MENQAFSMSYVREKAAQGENQIERTIHDILDLINHYPDFDEVFEALDNTYERYHELQQTTLDPARPLPAAARMSQVNHLHLKTLLEIAHVIGKKVLIGPASPFNDMFIHQEFSKDFMLGLVEAFECWFIIGPYHSEISKLDKMKVRDIFEAHEKNIKFLYDGSMSDVNHISILKAIFLTMYLMARDVETEWVAQNPATRLCTVLFPLNTEELTKRLSREFAEEGEKDVLEILHETAGKYTIQKLKECLLLLLPLKQIKIKRGRRTKFKSRLRF